MTGSSVLSPEELLAQYDWLRGLARALIRDRDRADDAAHETCVRALSAAPDDRKKVRPWLASILRNLVRQEARSSRARQERERKHADANTTAVATGPDPTGELVARVAVQHEVVAIVLRLEEVHRATVLLRFFEGLPQREIARRLQIPVTTVNSRLTRALQKIRAELDRTHGGDRQAWSAVLATTLRRAPFATAVFATTLGVLLMNAKLQIAAALLLVSGLLYFLWPGGDPIELDRPARAAIAPPAEHVADPPAPPAREVREDLVHATDTGEDAAEPETSPTFAEGLVLFADARPAPGIAIGFEGATASETTESDAAGRFRLLVPSKTSSGHRGSILVAHDPDYVTVLQGVHAKTSSIAPVVVIAKAVVIRGQVVSASGTAIAEAQVNMTVPDDFEARIPHVLDRSKRVRWHTDSAEDGRFEFARLPGIPGMRVRIAKQAYLPTDHTLTGHSDNHVFVVLKQPEAKNEPAVVGRVTDTGGRGVEGAMVAMGLTSTVSDANGNFHILHRRAGMPKSIRAVKIGYLVGRFAPTEGEKWPDFVELILPGEAKEIRGRVIDADGQPVPGALVWAKDASPFGLHGIVPISTEYLSAGGSLPRGQRLPPEVFDNPLEGDQDFNGMWHAKEPSACWYYVAADADGRFTLGGLQDRDYRIRAMHKGSILKADVGPITAGRTDVEIKMPADRSHPLVAGRLVLPNGEPAKGISISVFCSVLKADVKVPGGRFEGTLIRHGPRTKTDADGRFRFERVPAQGVSLSIHGDGIIPTIRRLDDAANVAELEYCVASRHHLEVIVDAPTDRADAIRGEDAKGGKVYFTVIRSGSMSQRPRIELKRGRSGVVVVPHHLRTVVLYKGEAEVGRIPVRLEFGKKTVVRY